VQLLNKTIRTYLVYSTVIIIAGIPVMYILLLNVIRSETSELLDFQKSRIQKELSAISTEQDLNYYLTLKDGLRILPSNIKTKLPDTLYQQEEFDKPSGEMIPYTVDRFYTSINGKLCVVEMRMSLLAAKALIRTIIKTQFFILAGLLTCLFLINKRMSNKIWKPFYRTLDSLQQYQVNENPGFKLEPSNIFEFNLLNNAINRLTEKNHRVFLAQKEFTDNAAHEMQTPLAILKSCMEILIQNEDLKEDQAALIEIMIDVCDRLSRLNISLLLLARIENKNEQFLQKDTIKVGSVLENLMKQFSEQFKTKNISCAINHAGDLSIVANKTFIEILCSNLISNAIKYNIDYGTFQIEIDQYQVSFINSGEPVSMDESRIFERFSKNSASQHSIGLGLAIVKRICEISGYRVSYFFRDHINAHVFEVVFRQKENISIRSSTQA